MIRTSSSPFSLCFRLLPLVLCWFPLLLMTGCGRETIPFNIAAAGLSLPRMSLNAGNANALLTRIHYMEVIQKIEKTEIQPHDLSLYLGNVVISNPPCTSKSCRSCLDGDETTGLLDLSCWTNDAFTGTLRLDVVSNEMRNGESYMDWNEVCTRSDKLCFQGSTGYLLQLDKAERTARLDLLWTVNLRVTPDGQDTTRLDGSMGFVFTKRTTEPAQTRKAIFLQDQSLLFRNYKDSNGTTSVLILSRGGKYDCTHNRTTNTGSCKLLQSAGGNDTTPDFTW